MRRARGRRTPDIRREGSMTPAQGKQSPSGGPGPATCPAADMIPALPLASASSPPRPSTAAPSSATGQDVAGQGSLADRGLARRETGSGDVAAARPDPGRSSPVPADVAAASGHTEASQRPSGSFGADVEKGRWDSGERPNGRYGVCG